MDYLTVMWLWLAGVVILVGAVSLITRPDLFTGSRGADHKAPKRHRPK
jgi:hypothetical protein